MNLVFRFIGLAYISSLIFLTSFTTSEIIKTTVVVIEGKALLVDVDERGDILHTYMEVPEYLNSTKKHEDKVHEAKVSYMRLSKLQMDQIRFIALLDQDEEYHVTMKQNLADLASHYHETYANEIVITVAQSDSIEDAMDYNVEQIRAALENYGVAQADISVDYKIDLGEDPAPFIKVSSRLRRLAGS